MRVVVTGASGNLGTAVVRRLAPHHDLVGVVRRPPLGSAEGLDALEWVAADLSQDSSADILAEVCAGADAVVHLAWAFQPSHRPDVLAATGIGGTARVLAAVGASSVRHLVHLSSVGAYSTKRDDEPVDETWPTDGVPSSPYSRHKVAAERLLDRFEQDDPGTAVTRLRPGIVGQRRAGSALLRYGLPALTPAALVRHVPVLPVDRGLRLPMVHADDVADAVARSLEAGVPGPFNLAAEPAITVEHLAVALRARHVHVPAALVRTAVSASWHARVQPLDPGWVDLALAVPLLDCDRAARELGWSPGHDAVSTLEETVAGMAERSHAATPALRPRTYADLARRFVTEGPVSSRRRP